MGSFWPCSIFCAVGGYSVDYPIIHGYVLRRLALIAILACSDKAAVLWFLLGKIEIIITTQKSI